MVIDIHPFIAIFIALVVAFYIYRVTDRPWNP